MSGKSGAGEKGALAALLKSKGIRLTPKRKLIAEILEKTDGHPDAEHLCRLAKKKDPSIGQATVYRTLRLMRENGVIKSFSFSGEQAKFESDAKKHHDHLICDRCGKIVEFVNDKLEEMKKSVALRQGFRMINHRLDIHGVCNVCLAKEKQKPACKRK